MDRLDYFERGRELYKGKRYEDAAEHFLLSIVKERSNVSRAKTLIHNRVKSHD